MNAFIRRACARRGFSVVEVLVTIAIITILMALFVPALNKVGEVAARVKQKAQFTNIEIGLEAYKNDYVDYPVSLTYDPADMLFCDGAQTLGEAIVGLDGLGLHPDSIFSPDRQDAAGVEIYYPDTVDPDSAQKRMGPYLENDAANAIRLGDIYDNGTISADGKATMVLADMFTKKMRTGIKAGMPILYYRANTANSGHDPATLANNIYNFDHNDGIIPFGTPWGSASPHVMDVTIFYRNTRDPRFTVVAQPYRSQSFILLSAGKDGLYGTADDVYNFDRVEQ